MLKKWIAVFSGVLSLAKATEEEKSLTKLPDELMVKCIAEACEEGLNLKKLQELSLVCKKWSELAPQSVKTLDLISLDQRSKYRHFTFMSFVLNYPYNRFPNLKELSLDFHSLIFWERELTLKLSLSGNQHLVDCASTDGELDAVDSEMSQFMSQVHTLFYKLVPPPFPDDTTVAALRQYEKDLMEQVQREREKSRSWRAGYQSIFERKKQNLVKASGLENTYDDVTDWIIVQSKLILFCQGFQAIETLIINSWNNMNLTFIAQMPQLKRLKLVGHTGDVFDPYSSVCLDGLGQMESPHGLEELVLTGRLHLTDFGGWSQFTHLKKLSLPIKFFKEDLAPQNNEECPTIQIQDPTRINEKLYSLAENLPHLEQLEISYRVDPQVHIGQWISQLKCLKSLTLSYCLICDQDFDAMLMIPNLQELNFYHPVDSRWEFWRTHRYSHLRKYIVTLLRDDVIPCEKYTELGLESFKEKVHDIKIHVLD